MKSSEIRKKFLDYFASKGHAVVASSSLVPHDDPTLLFTNAGMNQFKDVFLGFDKRPYTRAASSQKCVRAGGKHNDLENVGYTARHHTFFEMLGNFSFGDYFKREAIQYAWELLTKEFKLPKDKLYVTVYAEDDEAYDIWTKEIGVAPERVIRIGDNKGARYASDNFWMMGDTGPCGPCTEIFYDHGAHIPGGLPGTPEEDGDRYIEIWNNVFMQFNRDEQGVMHPLPKPSVDTGMGLERISAVLQGVHANYEIDLFQSLIKAAARETKCADLDSPSLKVLADHIRACSFLIADGIIPGNEGRGYVLRRIIRRAIRHGYKLGARAAFFYKMVADLDAEMGDAYPELRQNRARVAEILKLEEERFFGTLGQGIEILERTLDSIQATKKADFFIEEAKKNPVYADYKFEFVGGLGVRVGDSIPHFFVRDPDSGQALYVIVVEEQADDVLATEQELKKIYPGTEVKILERSRKGLVLPGSTAFVLHDTYGFPLDLTQDVCREHGVTVDVAAFDAAMAHQREQARAAGKFKMAAALEYDGQPTTFLGYEKLEVAGARITALYVDGTPVPEMKAGQHGVVVLDNTPFYAESGGQVGDAGELAAGGAVFAVQDTHKIQADVFGHHGELKSGSLKVGDSVAAKVDGARRARIQRNHSVTHLMHKALREVLGSHVQQKGSLVDPDKTRFDFAHNAPMTAEQIRKVEEIANAEILANAETCSRVLPIEEAQKLGAMMLFGEKYGDEVRVLDIGTSRELCGGTHVARTGDIGLFKIVTEGGVAAGVRRIEAITGDNALAYVQDQQALLQSAASTFKAPAQELPGKIAQIMDNVKALEKELARLKSKLASSQGDDLAGQVVEVNGVNVLAANLEGADAKTLRETLDKLKDKLKSAAIVLGTAEAGKVTLIAGVTADLTARVKAGELVNFVAQQVGGKGGGRPDMAQAGGTEPDKLPGALAGVTDWVKAKLG